MALAAGMEDMMSAIAWHPTDLGSTHPVAPRRPRLVVIDGAGQGGRAAAVAEPALRITRRGRLVLLVMATLALATVLGLRGLGGAGAAEPAHTVSVTGGQTLSEIAATELPSMSISDGIVAIQLANDLSTAQVRAGQQLVIPAG
ncbi:LysM peptidoglycan-binding domain-containing protein [Arthrobacter sp. NEB 688]|uniref:LysM peptidoglycan-binding domain-containing protein n=1 Tax=Arthrobacter sp. NEB 688 TaxID=904039 RepID=UPI001563B8DD|nr:LysM peptidoglycan-binding domain-containing protein [Arthrobacter sp. NEB 688]QKE84369.1 LysM peptidoglycan-binding domain-containing protein [Arthrobacter sp. NEB 688]